MGRIDTPEKAKCCVCFMSFISCVGLGFLSYGISQAVLAGSMNPATDFSEVKSVTVPCAGGCRVDERGRMIQVPCQTGNYSGETCGTGGCVIVSAELSHSYKKKSRGTFNVYVYRFSKMGSAAVVEGGEVDSQHAVGHRGNAPWLVGELRPCWERAVALSDLGAYSCGEDNGDCLTLSDPAGVKAGVQGGMWIWFLLGAVELTFGIGGIIIGVSMRRMMLAQQQGKTPDLGRDVL